MDITAAAHANNLFPTAQGDAPDLVEEPTAQSSPSTGFPAAPILRPGALAAEIVHLSAEPVVRTGTKVDQAIAYLATCPDRTAKRTALATALGIDQSDIVAYLKSALTDGRITRLGNLFSVGVEPAALPTKRVRAGAPKEQKAAPAPSAPAIEPTVARELDKHDDDKKPKYLPIATMSVSNFSVAVWPDGAMQVRSGGSTVELSALQMGVLQMFLELVETSGPKHS